MLRPKVFFVTPSAYPLGGVAAWLDYLEPGLSERGWDVVVGLATGPRHHRPLDYLAVHPHKNTLVVPCMTGTPEGRARAVETAVRQAGADLVVGVNIPDVYAGVGRMRMKRRLAPKVAMALHGIQADLMGDVQRYRRVLDGVVGVNRLCCRLARQMGRMEQERVHYAPCGVAIGRKDGGRQKGKDKLVIAWVGRLEQGQKRIDDIRSILNKLDESALPFELLVAGSGPDEARLRQDLAEQARQGTVTFFGNISSAEVSERVYAKAHVLLVTSIWETGPLVAWEAMAAKVGVVSSRYIGSGAEQTLVDGENALLFPVGEVVAAAQCLVRFWREPGLLDNLTANAYIMVSRRYSIDASVRFWDTAFRRIMEAEQCRDTACEFPTTGGRLDTWLGARLGELVRRSFRKKCPDTGPGGEWPHTHARRRITEEDFLARLYLEEFGKEVRPLQ